MVLHLTAQRRGKLVSFLRRELGLSSSLVKRLKWRGAFLVNGETAHTDRMVEVGEEITVVLSEDAPDYPAEDGALDILYEDDALLALDKPAGILMHPSFHRNTGTLANFVAGVLCEKRPGLRRSPGEPPRPRHLRRGAPGQKRPCPRPSHGRPAPGRPPQDLPGADPGLPRSAGGHLGRAPGQSPPARAFLRRVDPAGKIARTEYRVLETQGGLARLELHPLTGRTHQLRVHCAHAGCPILGDGQYGNSQAMAFGFSGQQPAGKGAFPAPSPHRRGC